MRHKYSPTIFLILLLQDALKFNYSRFVYDVNMGDILSSLTKKEKYI